MTSVAARHKYILETLQKEGFARVTDMAKDLDVTTVTIRNDFKILEDKGLLYRAHGSASSINPIVKDKSVTEKEKIKPQEKTRIGRTAATLILENDSIILNSGTTVCAFASELSPKGHLTIVTSSVKVTMILSEKEEDMEVLQLGGHFRKRSMSVIGNYTMSILNGITCSTLFLGVGGVDLEAGVTTSNLEEAELNRAMMNAASRTVVLCDSTKFGQKGFGKICDIDKVDIIITDSGITKGMKKLIEDQGVQLIIV